MYIVLLHYLLLFSWNRILSWWLHSKIQKWWLLFKMVFYLTALYMKQCSSFPSFLTHLRRICLLHFVCLSVFFLKKSIFNSYSNGCIFDTLMIAVMKNPANLAKHQANPKVAPVITKMMNKFGGGNMWWTSLIFSVFVYNLNFGMLKWVVRICLNAWFADSWQSLLLYPFMSFSSNLHSVSNIFHNFFTSFNVVGG